jgi:hypothetical protein
MTSRRLPLLLAASLLTGCNQSPRQASAPASPALADPAVLGRVAHLEEEVARLQTLSEQTNDEPAIVSFEENTYGVARNKFGAFPVVGQSVEPFLDGFKIRVGVGNLTGATFHGAKLRISSHGGLPPGFKRIGAAEKTIDVQETFRPGRYTTVEAVLSPAKATAMKSIEVSVEFDSISLK